MCSQPFRKVSAEASGFAPVALHHNVRADYDLAHFACPQIVVVGIENPHLDIRVGDSGGGEAPRLFGSAFTDMIMMRKISNVHRTFALPIQLDQAWAQFAYGGFEIVCQHGPTPVDQGLHRTEVTTIQFRAIDQHFYHRGRSEHIGHFMLLNRPQHDFRGQTI